MSYRPEFDIASPLEDAASSASLALAPWVAERAAALREIHYARRAGENAETTARKVDRWRAGLCMPRDGGHRT